MIMSPARNGHLTMVLGAVGLLLVFRFLAHTVQPNFYLQDVLHARAGERETLPAVVNEGLGIVRHRRLPSINLAPELKSDALLYERFVESLYPIRVDSLSQVSLTIRPIEPGCKRLEAGKLITLVECP
jgi:hypothetical protein